LSHQMACLRASPDLKEEAGIHVPASLSQVLRWRTPSPSALKPANAIATPATTPAPTSPAGTRAFAPSDPKGSSGLRGDGPVAAASSQPPPCPGTLAQGTCSIIAWHKPTSLHLLWIQPSPRPRPPRRPRPLLAPLCHVPAPASVYEPP